MQKITSKLVLLPVMLCILLGFSSCEEDFWWGDYGDEEWAAQQLVGSWRIVEASPWGTGDVCPYEYGDVMSFQPDGIMHGYGFDLNETAYWSVRGRYIYLEFGSGRYDYLKAYISQMDSNYLVLDVTDYSYGGARYRLRLIYTGHYSQKKEPAESPQRQSRRQNVHANS